jgi:hypothetical protein
MNVSSLNFLMSCAEAGVVVGVILEGTEHIPRIHKRWPKLERLGFIVLVVCLIGDWNFQARINEHNTNDLIAAKNRIVELSPRYWLLTTEVNKSLVDTLKPFAGQRIELKLCSGIDDWHEAAQTTLMLWDNVFNPAKWLVKYSPEPCGGSGGSMAVGITATAAAKTISAAKALVSTLHGAGLMPGDHRDVTVFPNSELKSSDTIALIIFGRSP